MEKSHISVRSDGRTWCATQSSGGWGSFLASSKSTRGGKKKEMHTCKDEGRKTRRKREFHKHCDLSLVNSKCVFISASQLTSLLSLVSPDRMNLVDTDQWILCSVYYSQRGHENWWFYSLFSLLFLILLSLLPGDLLCDDLLRLSHSRGPRADDHVSIYCLL